MDESKTNILVSKFSNIFPEDFWFEVGDGWFQILHDLFEAIEKVPIEVGATDCECWHEKIDHPETKCENEVRDSEDTSKILFSCSCPNYRPLTPRVAQIKEKFGALRIYINNTNEEIEKLVRKAESASAKTCEYCGKEGKQNGSGYWLKTLCVSCGELFQTKGHVGMMQSLREDKKPNDSEDSET